MTNQQKEDTITMLISMKHQYERMDLSSAFKKSAQEFNDVALLSNSPNLYLLAANKELEEASKLDKVKEHQIKGLSNAIEFAEKTNAEELTVEMVFAVLAIREDDFPTKGRQKPYGNNHSE